AAKNRKSDEFEDVDRRVAAFGEAAGRRAARRDRRLKNAAGVPALKLPGSETGEAGHLARAVARLQPHAAFPAGESPATRCVPVAPSMSLRVMPPSSCVDQLTLTRL